MKSSLPVAALFLTTLGLSTLAPIASADDLQPFVATYQVFHDGHQVTPATCSANSECVKSITFDKKKCIWTIVTTAKTNGSWDW